MATFPEPLNPVAVTEPDVYEAVFDFIEKFALPTMSDAPSTGRIFRGFQSREVLPSDNEYAIITILNQQREGSTIETFDATDKATTEDGTGTLTELVLVQVQIDFFSDPMRSNDYARRRAQSLETVARSSWGWQFFHDGYGIGCADVTNPKDLSSIGDADQYVRRWEIELTLAVPTTITGEIPWFSNVDIERIENVDVHHPPK